jgi:hypothetical protein
MTGIRLLAVVEVPQSDRVARQAPNCKHPVHKRIHVVLQSGKLTVLGSECFKKLFGEEHSAPSYGSSDGRLLTPEERQLLVENTSRLIAQFEAEHQAALERERLATERRAKLAAEKQAAIASAQRAAEQRRLIVAERQSSFAMPAPAPAMRTSVSSAPRTTVPSTSDPRFQAALAQVKKEYRARGLDPDQPGWRGIVQHEAKERLR